MYRVTVVFFLFCIAGFSADLSGKWTGRSQLIADSDGSPGRVVDGAVLDLAQSGEGITGTYTAPGEPAARLQFFRIENDRIVMWFHTARNVLITGNLTLKDGWISGRLTRSSGEVTRIAVRRQ